MPVNVNLRRAKLLTDAGRKVAPGVQRRCLHGDVTSLYGPQVPGARVVDDTGTGGFERRAELVGRGNRAHQHPSRCRDSMFPARNALSLGQRCMINMYGRHTVCPVMRPTA